MHIRAALVTALLWAASVSAPLAQPLFQPEAMVGLQPLSDPPSPDLEALLKTQWPAYYRAGEAGFSPAQVRVGRIDLNGDGSAELLVLLEAPDWRTLDGGPLLVARWKGQRWVPIGWAYAEAETVYVTAERLRGWASLETGAVWLRWDGQVYRPEPHPSE